MRNASNALKTFLNTATEFYVADLLTIIPVSGATIYLTSASINVTAVSQVDSASHVFLAGGGASGLPTFTRDRVKLIVGLQVDSMGLSLASIAGQTLGGLPWPQQAVNGYFDGARVVLERCYMPTFGDTSKGTLIEFWGIVGAVVPSRTAIKITVNSDLILLDLPLPKNLYGPGCLHNLYDAGCTLVRATFTVTGTASTGSTASAIKTSRTEADGYFELGAITFTSGANNGLTRTVKTFAHTNGLFSLAKAFPAAPANGDTFSAYPGCDKKGADASGNVNNGTCKVKFNNLAHFRGAPYIPAPENAR